MSQHMRAAVVREKGGEFKLEEASIREPQDDEVRVQIVATGMCHTDMICRDQMYPVPLPSVFGHEGSGIIESVGPNVKNLKKGDHVVLSFGYCNHCTPCATGHTTYCNEFYERNFSGADEEGNNALTDAENQPLHDHFFAQSSFAEYAISRESNTVKVDPSAPIELLGPLGCGIQTGAGAVINSLQVRPGSTFVAYGGGAVGLSAVMAARICGASTIIVTDVVDSRLTLALELGATHTINSLKEDPVARIKDITGGGADFAIESTGRPEVLRQGIDALGKMGTIGVVGAPALGTDSTFDVNDLLLGGKSIRGIVEGDSIAQEFIPKLVQLYQQGRFPFDKLIKFYPFEQINEAAKDSEKGITLKPVIRIG